MIIIVVIPIADTVGARSQGPCRGPGWEDAAGWEVVEAMLG